MGVVSLLAAFNYPGQTRFNQHPSPPPAPLLSTYYQLLAEAACKVRARTLAHLLPSPPSPRTTLALVSQLLFLFTD